MQENELAFEREKLQASLARQDKELSFKEKELDLRQQELARSILSTPLGLAVAGAIIAALGNIVTTYLAGVSQRDVEVRRTEGAQILEEKTAESQRILEMIKTAGNPDKAAVNLQFLLDTKLISKDRQGGIEAYLKKRKPGEGAALGAAGVCTGKPDGTPCGSLLGGKGLLSCQNGLCL